MANTRPPPSFPTTLGSEGRTGYIPWLRYKSFMLIGACSTPISTWQAGGDDRIERLDDAGTWRQGRHDLARARAAEIGEDELRSRLDEGIRRIDEHPAVPCG